MDPAGLVEESFENAAPASLSGHLPEHPAAQTAVSPSPSGAELTSKINPATRRLLAELFKTEISVVRRISRDQLR